MQKARTLEFWDRLYEQEQQQQNQQPSASVAAKEWILQPTPALLEQLAAQFPKPRHKPLRILEIGCGTSTLVRDLWVWRQQQPQAQQPDWHICATDVSAVGIQQITARDADVLQASGGTLEYRVLNAATPQPADWMQQGAWDVILDKGCLDTFLFRSKQPRGGQANYGALVRTVLDNMHGWLRDSDESVYMALSPRPKHKATRDYRGFSSVQRSAMDLATLRSGDIQGSTNHNNDRVFLYTCRKNPAYDPSVTTNAFGVEPTTVAETDTCAKCHMTFQAFRKGGKDGRSAAVWFRQWQGHVTHCPGLVLAKP